MFKKIGSLAITLLSGALLVYSATRSVDFISATLPSDRQILAWCGIAALDGGLLAWMAAYSRHARGGWQRAISLIMVCVDVCGAVAMFTADTLYNTGAAGMTAALSATQITSAVLVLSAVIAANIIATIAYHLSDVDSLKQAAEEEAFAKVEDATLKQIASNADALAAQLAPLLAADWQRQTEARYMAQLGATKPPAVEASATALVAPKADWKRLLNPFGATDNATVGATVNHNGNHNGNHNSDDFTSAAPK